MRKGGTLMIRKHTLIRCYGAFLVLALVAAMTGTASGVEFYLRADAVDKTMPDDRVVPMWGFALTDDTYGPGTATVPGPLLEVPPGDSILTIHVQNNLPERISLVIPGQITNMEPVFLPLDGQGRQRVKSFTHEAAADGGEATYTWTNVQPGTYLYQSGTHPGVQVQMGLYGAVKKDHASGQAYDSDPLAATAYDKEGIVLFSEIDPDLHAVVANGSYGDADDLANNPKQITSPMDYAPKYFLINGDANLAGTGVVQTGQIIVGEKILVRLLNAGLITRVPLLLGSYMTVLAQDGNLAPFLAQKYSLTLTAGKTMDVLVTPTIAGFLGISDRRGYVTPGATAIGGTVGVVPVPGPPVEPPDGETPPPDERGVPGTGGGGGGWCFISTVLN
jgi:FtsP/CotA-like multicopper oxidase with cupredoxin domain